MQYILLGCLLWFGIWGCQTDPVPDNRVDITHLKRQFEASGASPETRVELGVQMVVHDEGQTFLVQQYGHGRRRVVQAVIDSVMDENPDAAAHLLAKLMAAAGGESKLQFESQLIRLGDSAVDALVVQVESETDWQTLMRSLDALGKLQAKQGVPMMRKHLNHPNDWVRIAAAHALGDVGGKDVVPPLIDALDDSSDTVVSAALIGLGNVGDSDAVVACASQLKHTNPRVRAAAVSALARLGGAQVRDLLEPMLKDVDSGVRYKTKQALTALNK